MVGEAKTVSRSGGLSQELVSIGYVEKTDRQAFMMGVPDAGGGKGVKLERK